MIASVSQSFHLLYGCGANAVGDRNQTVDGNVNGYDFGTMFTIAQHGTNDTFGTAHHYTDRPIQTVNPSF